MQTRLFALVFGVVYVLVGIIGLFSAFYTAPPSTAPHVDVTTQYGYLLGQFPVNLLHDLFHILVGLVGIVAGARFALARFYSQTLFFLFGALTVLGFLPQANTLWGLIPLFGSDTWLHAVTALAAGYFGFVAPESTHVEPVPETAH